MTCQKEWFKQKVFNHILFISIISSCISCQYSYLNRENMLHFDDPPCFKMQNEQVQKHNFLALLSSFKNSDWIIKGIDTELFFLVAEACQSTYCFEVIAKVDENGFIKIHRTSDRKISRNGTRLLKRWMDKLKRNYFNYRCESTQSLIDKNK